MRGNADQHTDQDALIAALRGTTRRLDNENDIMRDALARIAKDARAGHSARHIAAEALQAIDALNIPDAVIGTLASILEHGSHAWRALEVAELAENNPDGAWPPQTRRPAGSAAYHLAVMLQYTKGLYDALLTPPPRSAAGREEDK